jgi:uncharacterized protein (TIRG00374 family)
MKAFRNKSTYFGIFLSLLTIVYISSKLDWEVIHYVLSHLNLGWLITALLIFLINYLLRTIRLSLLINSPRVSFQKLWVVTSLYGFFNYVMPARSGELSLLYLLKSKLEIPFSKSSAVLAISRALDFSIVAMFVPIFLIFYWKRLSPSFIQIMILFFGLFFLLILVFLFILRFGDLISNRIAAHSNSDKQNSGFGKLLSRLWNLFSIMLDYIRLINLQRKYRSLTIITLIIWLSVFTNFYLIILSMGYQLKFLQILVISFIMVPASLLPFQGFANIGIHELGWVAAFGLFGYARDISIVVAVGSHAILLTFVIFLGLSGTIMNFLGAKLRFIYLSNNR